jgi:hypothetical protein
MGLLRRHDIDDVDVDSCLANLHRVDELVPDRVVDLRARLDLDRDVAEARRIPTPARA